MSWTERTELLVGKENLAKLKKTNVLVVGLGGVGAYAAELICRAGTGRMTIIDGDVVEETNRNRQLPALICNQGTMKTEIMAKRLMEINPELELQVYTEFLKDERIIELLDSQHFDYIVDAIDTLSPKAFLLFHSVQRGYKVVSSMGAGGKLDPTQVKISDLSESNHCRLARMLRKRLSRLGIKKGITVVYSTEKIPKNAVRTEEGQNKKSVVGTISYLPSVFGCFLASAVIRGILDQ